MVGGSDGFAAAIAVIAIVITTLVFLVQKYVSNKNAFALNSMHPVEEREARKGINALVHLAVYLVVGIAILPQAYVIYTSFKNTQGKIFVDGYSLQSYQTAIGKLGRSIQNTIIIPLLALGVLRSLGRISDFKVDNRRERLLPLLVGAVCYVLCAITIAKIPSAIFLRKFMVAAACCEVLCLVVSFYWKISLHLTGMGAVVALLVVMNVVGVGNMLVPLMVAILCAGALASARLYLGCHNGWQVLAGFCGGFAVSVLAVLFL